MPRCKYNDIVLRQLTEDGISKSSIYFQDTVAMNTFLDRHPNYSTKHIKSKKYIVTGGSTPNKRYYVVLKVDGTLTPVNLQVADFYSTHIWQDGKIHERGHHRPVFPHAAVLGGHHPGGGVSGRNESRCRVAAPWRGDPNHSGDDGGLYAGPAGIL